MPLLHQAGGYSSTDYQPLSALGRAKDTEPSTEEKEIIEQAREGHEGCVLQGHPMDPDLCDWTS